MLNRIRYIALTFLLMVAFGAAGQTYVIDSLCVNSERHYRINGEVGSTYLWILKNQAGVDVSLTNPTGTPFTGTDPVTKLPIVGSEIAIQWNNPGIFDLEAIQYSINGCDTIQQGRIKVFEQPLANAGPPVSICGNLPVTLNDATASNYRGLIWITSGDGSFNNYFALNPVYTPGPNDRAAKTVTLTLRADGYSENATCISAVSTVVVTLNPLPNLVIKDPAPICEPETINLGNPAFVAGSDPGLVYEYYTDLAATKLLTNADSIGTSGTYYIKATNPATSCSVVKPIHIVVHPRPLLVIHNPAPVCQPNTIDLSVASVTAGSDAGLTFAYYTDSTATIPLANHKAVASGGKYYIKGTNPTTGCSTIRPVKVTINPIPVLVTNNPTPVCEPETVDLTDPAILAGSFIPDSAKISYWKDAGATSQVFDPKVISATALFYIKAETEGGCIDIKPVFVVVNPLPVVVINDPEPVCEPSVVNLTDSAVFKGSEPHLTYQYFRNPEITLALAHPDSVKVTGTYYIKATNPTTGCFVTKPVNVTINPEPVLVITNPDPICENETTDLTAPEVTAGSTIPSSSVWTYWTDAALTKPVPNEKAVHPGTYYIKVVTPGKCFDVKAVIVPGIPIPVLVTKDPAPVCEPQVVDLSDPALYIGSEANLDYSFYFDNKATIPLPNYKTVSAGGTYYVKGTNNVTGCSVVDSIKVTILPMPKLVITNPPAVCQPITVDLSDPAIVAGSETPLNYEYFSDTTVTSPLLDFKAIAVSGKYFIKATSPTTGCSTIKPVIVIINPQPALVIHDPAPACAPEVVNLTDPAIWSGSIVPTSSVFSYWLDAAATNALSNEKAVTVSGTYYIKVEAPGGCSDIKPVKVVVYPEPLLVTADPPEVCEPQTIDLSDPSIIAAAEAGLVYSYFADAKGTIPLANYKAINSTGTYYIKGSNTNCSVIRSVYVIVNKLITPEFAAIGNLCVNSIAPLLPVVSNNGIAGTWSPSVINTSVAGESAYTFTPVPTVCAKPLTIMVKVVPKTNPVFNTIPTLCQGSPAPALPFVSNNGVVGTWTPASISTTVPGDYYFKFTPLDPTCGKDTTIMVTISPQANPVFDPIGPLCFNSTPPVLPTVSKNGISGTWSPATISTSNAGLFDYTFTPDGGLCVSGKPMQIMVTNPLILTETHVNVGYSPDPIGSIDLTVSGGYGTYTYLWSNGETTQDISKLPAGSYTVIVTDGNSCPDSLTVNITSEEPMTIAAVGIDSPCPGLDGSIAFTFTNVPDGTYTIFYKGGSFPNVAVSDNAATIQAAVGKYTDMKLFYNGTPTSNVANATVGQNPQITLSATATASYCSNTMGTIELNFENLPDGRYDISYDGGKFSNVQFSQGYASISAIPGTYSNIHLDYGFCISSPLITVKLDNPKSLIPLADVVQPNCDVPYGSITVTFPKFGKGYKYRIDGGSYQASPTFTNLVPGRTYTIQAIKVNDNCESETTAVTIYNLPAAPEKPAATVITPPTCAVPTGKVSVIKPLGNQYTYSIDGGAFQKSTDFPGLKEGEHQLTVKDITTFCTTTATIAVDSLPKSYKAPLAVITSQPNCYNPTGSIEVTDPLPGTGFHYSIDGVIFQESNIFNDVLPGEYQIQVRSKATMCPSDVTKLTILLPVPPDTPVATVSNPDCNVSVGKIEVKSPLGANYQYVLDGIFTQKSPVFANLTAGTTHTVKVIDTVTGCESASITLNIGAIPPPLAPPVKLLDPEECALPSIQTLDARSAVGNVPGVSIIWYDSATGGNVVANPTLNKVSSVTYYAESFDGVCRSQSRTPVTLTINAVPAIPVSKGNITECEESPIQTLNANSAIVMVPGVTPVWYDAPTGGSVVQPILNTVGTKTYYAEAWNGDCSSNGRTAVTLTILPMPMAPVSNGDLEACEDSPMPVLNANNALQKVPGQNIIWYDRAIGGNVVANPTLNKIGSVTYYAIDFNGNCASAPRTAVTLTIHALPVKPVAQVTIAPTCKEITGTATVTSPVGPNFLYSFDNATFQPSPTLAGLLSGKHSVKVKNQITGCESDTTVFTMPEVPPIPHIINVTTTNCICYGDSGAINFEFLNVNDGTYVIVYMGGRFENVEVEAGKAQVLAPAGNYNVLAIEANGCTSSESWNVTITQPDKLSVSGAITEIDLKTHQKGEIDISISGGTGKYLTEWLPNPEIGFAGATTEDIKNLENGEYTVRVTDESGCWTLYTDTIPKPNLPPIATNDEFDAKCNAISGDLINGDNGSGVDSDPDGDVMTIDTNPVALPLHGTLTINADGTFAYLAYPGYTGDDTFKYRIRDVKNNYSNIATVTIHIIADFDCDGIPDDLDPDADGDGILNIDEGGLTADSDGDGHPNWLDIDADNDGIVDNIEGQTTEGYIAPLPTDTDNDGINDAYDPDNGGTRVVPVDTDKDGIPDFLDVDSDGDHVPDYIEGHDQNADGKIDRGHMISGRDTDADGLDNAWDTADRFKEPIANITGSNAPIQDFDGDGIKDWRDENDDDDQYLTRFEDLNMDGDYSNDDTDLDGHPEYLDLGRDCDLFIPNAFSPNGDGIHDYFQIYCIDHYPDAKIYIFDQAGNLLYEKANYGNLLRWITPDQAWWNGTTRNRNASTSTGGRVVPGTYYYVLNLGNGEVKKSFVFISY